MREIGTLEELVDYKLDEMNEETIEISLKDLLYLQRVLEEMMRFIHDEDHYETLNCFKKFLGVKNSGGAFDVINRAFYDVIYEIDLPKDVQEKIDDGFFESDKIPFYYLEQKDR